MSSEFRVYTHHLLFDWDGELIGHVQDRFTAEDQTDPQPANILERVRFRARNVGHHETDAELLSTIFDWVVLDEAIDVLEDLDLSAIMGHFMDFLEAIRDPPVHKVEFTALYLHLDDANEELIDQSDPVTFYSEDQDLVHTPVSLEREPDVYVTISPLTRPFACDHAFRDLIVHQLKCQIRELYYMQASQPPREYQIDGVGIHDTKIEFLNVQPNRIMQAKIIGIEDGVIGVEVIDPRGNQHIIEIPVDNDEASDYHGQNVYPHSSEERTEDQERLMNQVFARARFEAHINTNYDILLSDWDPRQLRRGIDALEKMPLNQFDEAFREYYHALINPERTKQEYGITEGRVEFEGEPRIALIMKGFCINDENEVVEVLPDMYIYYSKEDIEETYTTGTPASCSEGTTQITPMVPPFVEVPEDFVYPEDFRGFLINNLICQIRDVYRNMGETPPKQYDIEGYGKPKGNFDRDEY